MTLPLLPRLYVVTDRHQLKEGALPDILPLILSLPGVMLQLREKDLSTRELLALVQAVQVQAALVQSSMLINDRLDVALVVEAAGVHLRADSLPVRQVRKYLGENRIIGVSVHSVEEVRHCQDAGADFAVLGPVFDTPSKRAFGPPIGLRSLSDACVGCRIPIYAIGGITLDRVNEVREAGAYGVAVISAIWQADDPVQAVKDFTTRLGVPNSGCACDKVSNPGTNLC